LFYYGFPTTHLGPARYVDGAYARSIILNELTGAKRIYAVKPINDRWLGRLAPEPVRGRRHADRILDGGLLPRAVPAHRDHQRPEERGVGWLRSSREQRDNGHVTETEIESRIRRVSRKKYKDVELIPVEIAIQRGFFTYFVEDREVFRDAYGQSLQLLMERDEDDGRRERDETPRHTGARGNAPVK
jgi:hypothetical protein